MVTQFKMTTQTNIRTWLDIIMVGLGMLLGGIVAFIGIWFWLDYQTNPNQSPLAILSANLIGIMPLSISEYLRDEAQLMGLPLAGQTSAFWYMARAGGFVGYLLLWLSMVWGLTLSTKIVAGRVPAPIAYGLHEFLSLLALLFSVFHAAVLLGDEYIQFTVFHLTIPFISPYQPLWTGIGIIALYLSILLTATFYIRKLIGQKMWRMLHYFTFVVFLLVLGHGAMAGTDSSLTITKLMYLGTSLSVLFLVYYRLFTLKIKNKKPGRV